MTVKAIKKDRRLGALISEPSSVALGVLCIFSFLLIFKNPDIAIKRMSSALQLCAETVIPSLFPFMALSELLVSGNAVSAIAPLLRRPAKLLFGIGGESAAAVLLGLFCGYPIGAKSAAALYKRGSISKGEFIRVMTFSNNPSSAFLISAVGASMFGSREFGVLLFAISTLSALIIGLTGKFIIKERSAPIYCDSPSAVPAAEKKSGVELFTGAISSSALSMLSICAFVVFFYTLVGALEYAVSALALPDGIAALGFGFFELTGGIRKAAELPLFGPYLAAAISGWSGLSVHFQIMSVCRGCGISFRPYIFSKLAAGLLNTLLLLAYGAIFGLPL